MDGWVTLNTPIDFKVFYTFRVLERQDMDGEKVKLLRTNIIRVHKHNTS